jgi:hypothetical protein
MGTGAALRTAPGAFKLDGRPSCPLRFHPPRLPQPHLQKLVLRMDDLKTFMQLGVKAPTTTAEVPAALEALEAKKKVFEEKRDKVGRRGVTRGWCAGRQMAA